MAKLLPKTYFATNNKAMYAMLSRSIHLLICFPAKRFAILLSIPFTYLARSESSVDRRRDCFVAFWIASRFAPHWRQYFVRLEKGALQAGQCRNRTSPTAFLGSGSEAPVKLSSPCGNHPPLSYSRPRLRQYLYARYIQMLIKKLIPAKEKNIQSTSSPLNNFPRPAVNNAPPIMKATMLLRRYISLFLLKSDSIFPASRTGRRLLSAWEINCKSSPQPRQCLLASIFCTPQFGQYIFQSSIFLSYQDKPSDRTMFFVNRFVNYLIAMH